jgi:DNA-directed RNA polymerase specialized sigma24 family protein
VSDMQRQLSRPLTLGDVRDVEAYVRTIVARLGLVERDEFEDFVSEGLALVASKHKSLQPGQSLQQALSGWLACRLRDHWRQRHREWRRDSRAATAYALPVPTGLAWEHPEEAGEETALAARDESKVIDSRLGLQLFQHESDLRDPRTVGRYRGVPSWAGVATGRSRELWAQIQEERHLTSDGENSPLPRFLKPEDVL